MKKIKLLQNAYIAGYKDNRCYTARAYDPEKYNLETYDPIFDDFYTVAWKIINPNTDDEQSACNWDEYTVLDPENNITDAIIIN